MRAKTPESGRAQRPAMLQRKAGRVFGREELRALGRALHDTRGARGWSLKRLASASKISVGAIQRIEAGEASASLLTVAALAEALGTSMDRLVRASLAATQATSAVHVAIPRRFAGTLDVTGALDAPRMRAHVVALAPRSSRLIDTRRDGASLFAFVIGGKINLAAAAGAADQLAAGDAIHWSVPEQMTWSNPTDRPMLALCVIDLRGDAKSAQGDRATPGGL